MEEAIFRNAAEGGHPFNRRVPAHSIPTGSLSRLVCRQQQGRRRPSEYRHRQQCRRYWH
jgi:hypothetical protein